MDASERKEMLSVNYGRLEMNQMIFPDDAALVADSEKLCRLVSEFGRVCKRIKFTGNRSSRYGNVRMHVRLNAKCSRNLIVLSTFVSQVETNGGCEGIRYAE